MANRWSDYYVANEADGGYLQALCEKDHIKGASWGFQQVCPNP
jgi:hypothetical protein